MGECDPFWGRGKCDPRPPNNPSCQPVCDGLLQLNSSKELDKTSRATLETCDISNPNRKPTEAWNRWPMKSFQLCLVHRMPEFDGLGRVKAKTHGITNALDP